MTSAPDSTDALLGSLRRFFLLRYAELVRNQYSMFYGVFPLVDGSRLDMIRVNGGDRVHFVYRPGAAGENLVVVHDLTIQGPGENDEAERGFVRGALRIEAAIAHFVVRPPFDDEFEHVGGEAEAAVRRQAHTRIGHVAGLN